MVMDDRAQVIALLGVCATVAISVVAVAQAYVRSVEARRKAPRQELDSNVQDRMSRIEQAVDAIAIEVERMSEGQRFTTRLLAERFGQGSRAESATAQSVARRPSVDDENRAGGNHGR
jgi:heme exporter protein D